MSCRFAFIAPTAFPYAKVVALLETDVSLRYEKPGTCFFCLSYESGGERVSALQDRHCVRMTKNRNMSVSIDLYVAYRYMV